MRAGALLCALFLGVASAGVVQPCSWKLFKQCDSRWAQHPLGTSSNTICSDGCAMSSVAMSVASKGETINGTAITPDTLNRWLTEHSGYADKDLIVWNAVSALGALHTTDSTHSLPIDKLRDHVKQCHPVIVNVRNGFDDSSSTFMVNDPGFRVDSYQYSDMLRFEVYGGASEQAVSPVVATASQPTRAKLFDALERP